MVYRLIMRYDATEKLLNTARRHLWLQGLIDRGWLGFMWMSGVLALAAGLHSFTTAMTITWWGPVALLPLAVTTIVTIYNRPTLEASARAADRWLNAHDLMTAAWHLRSQTDWPTSTAALVVLDKAEQLATDPARSLSHFRNPRHPLPPTLAIATAATSLFFLSLQGSLTNDGLGSPVLEEAQILDQRDEDPWLPILDFELKEIATVVGDKQSTQEPISSSSGSLNEPASRTLPVTEERGQAEPGSVTQSNSRQTVNGNEVGLTASIQSPGSEPGPGVSKGIVSFKDLEFVALQRRPAAENVVIDRATSVELIPFVSDFEQVDTVTPGALAARVAHEPFSASVGPAYKALLARYFEEITHVD